MLHFTRRWVLGTILTGLVTTGMSLPAMAQPGNATVTVIHGINGTDLGLDEELPVTVTATSANGSASASLGFRDQVTVSLAAGPTDLAVFLDATPPVEADPTPILSASATLVAGKNYTAIAHLDASGAPALSLFENDISSVTLREGKVAARHTAAAPAVDIRLATLRTIRTPTLIEDVVNGDSTAFLTVPVNLYFAAVSPAGVLLPVIGPSRVVIRPRTAVIVYAVGSLENDSLELLVQQIPLPVTRP
jgi:hypothetical protein